MEAGEDLKRETSEEALYSAVIGSLEGGDNKAHRMWEKWCFREDF